MPHTVQAVPTVSDEQVARLIAGAERVVVGFYRRAEHTSRSLEGKFLELLGRLDLDVPAVAVDVDENEALARATGLTAIPALVVYAEATPVLRHTDMEVSEDLTSAVRRALLVS